MAILLTPCARLPKHGKSRCTAPGRGSPRCRPPHGAARAPVRTCATCQNPHVAARACTFARASRIAPARGSGTFPRGRMWSGAPTHARDDVRKHLPGAGAPGTLPTLFAGHMRRRRVCLASFQTRRPACHGAGHGSGRRARRPPHLRPHRMRYDTPGCLSRHVVHVRRELRSRQERPSA